MFSGKTDNGERKESGGRDFTLALILTLGVVIGVAVFLARVSDVGVFVSLADSVLVSALVPLFASACAFIYRFGGFDIFIFSFSRIFGRRRGDGTDDYYDFLKRARKSRGIALPLLLIGGVLLVCSAVMAFI